MALVLRAVRARGALTESGIAEHYRLTGRTATVRPHVEAPAPQRVYGYYVLPVLRGDRIVGRADLKSDRPAGLLRVLAFHRERGVRDSAALDTAITRALERLARLVGLAGVAPRG